MSISHAIERTTRRLGDAKAVGQKLDCSWRTVLRLADAGKIPQGYKLGALRRWDMAEIEAFIAGGCKPPIPTARGCDHDPHPSIKTQGGRVEPARKRRSALILRGRLPRSSPKRQQ